MVEGAGVPYQDASRIGVSLWQLPCRPAPRDWRVTNRNDLRREGDLALHGCKLRFPNARTSFADPRPLFRFRPPRAPLADAQAVLR
jgi:hypothetical protein